MNDHRSGTPPMASLSRRAFVSETFAGLAFAAWPRPAPPGHRVVDVDAAATDSRTRVVDTALLNSLISHATTNITLLFSSGRYVIRKPIICTSAYSVSFIGSGYPTLFHQCRGDNPYENTAFLLKSRTNRVILRGLSLVGHSECDGAPAPTWRAGLLHQTGGTYFDTVVELCRFDNFNVAVSVAEESSAACIRPIVQGNTITRACGSGSGHGYGIHVLAREAKIRNNTLIECDRHSIYVAGGEVCDVCENRVYRHRTHMRQNAFRAAIAISRANAVVLRHNRVIGFAGGALEISHDSEKKRGCTNVHAFGNKFLRPLDRVWAVGIGEQRVPTAVSTRNVFCRNNLIEVSKRWKNLAVMLFNGNNVYLDDEILLDCELGGRTSVFLGFDRRYVGSSDDATVHATLRTRCRI